MKYQWNITPDVEDNDFTPLVNKILNSNKSCFLDGPGGAGKSYLINMLKPRIREMNVNDDNVETEQEKQDSSKIMKIKKEYEIIKTKILSTTERLKTKLSKTRKQAALDKIKNDNLKLE